jgi:competence protein ComEC
VLALVVLLGLGMRRGYVLLAAVAGFLWATAAIAAHLADRLPPALNGSDVAVTGWIDDFPRAVSAESSFSLRVTATEQLATPRRIRLTWYQVPAPLTAAEGLCLVVRLHRPRGLVNPGGFDYERWALAQGYGASGYVRSGRSCAVAAGGAARVWLGLRATLAERIERAAGDDDAAALLTALVLGARHRFSDRHWDVLRRTGTSHLFAISGLHVGLIAALVFFVVRWLWLRLPMTLAVHDLEAAVAASLLIAALYAALAGFTVPTQRALLMLVVAGAAIIERKQLASASALASALAFVLIWDPMAPLGVSFWLSFLAVALLIFMAQCERRGEPSRGIRRALAAFGTLARLQWGLTLGLVAATLYFFGQLSLLSPLVNLLAVPAFSIVLVPLALADALLLALVEPAPAALQQWVNALAQGTWLVLERAAGLHWAALTLPRPAWWASGVAFLGVLCLVPGVPPLPGRGLAGLALLALLEGFGARPEEGQARVTVLDVGHGLAVLVATRRHALLYDTGPRYRSGFDAGAAIVLPAIKALGITRLDRVLVSHGDNDHAGGLRAVLASEPGAQLLVGADVRAPEAELCHRGQQWRWDGVQFSVLHPPADYAASGNNGSCVLRIVTGAGAVLLAGDLEAPGEAALLAAQEALNAEVVVVPHHGSATSSTAAFVRAVAARFAVVSAGFDNRWGFPKPAIRERWRQSGADVLVTGERGAVTIEMGRLPLRVATARGGRRRYWRN